MFEEKLRRAPSPGDEDRDHAGFTNLRNVKASEVRELLDQNVIGQDEAKERLSILISMHLCWDFARNPLHQPPNGVIIGPTGCGKTYSAQVASAALKVPFIIVDSTTLVPAGAASGNPVDSLRGRIFDEVKPGEKCIIFLDEFDKLATKELDNNRFWKTDIQRGLLKFIEGQGAVDMREPSRRALVFVGGAFIGIDGVENYRKRRPEVSVLLRKAPKGTIVPDDIINYGFLPELVARLPAIIQFQPLSTEVLLSILKHPISSPLKVWEQYFLHLGKHLVFTDAFYDAVARRASTLALGARGLQQIVFPALARRAYAIAESDLTKINITEQILDFEDGQSPQGNISEASTLEDEEVK